MPDDLDEIKAELRASCDRIGLTIRHDDSIDSEAAALLLHRAARTIENWRSAGTGPEWVNGKRVRYRLSALASWLATERAK